MTQDGWGPVSVDCGLCIASESFKVLDSGFPLSSSLSYIFLYGFLVFWYPTILITQVPVFQQNVELSNAIFSQGVSQHNISQRVSSNW